MTDLARTVALAEKYGIALDLVGDDRLHWRSRGPTPDAALAALKAAKPELVDLLTRYQLDSSGALAGDGLLADLRASGFAVRRYNRLAGINDDRGPVSPRVPAPPLLDAFSNKRAEYSCALRALGARTASQACARRTRQPNRKQPKGSTPPRRREISSIEFAISAFAPTSTAARF